MTHADELTSARAALGRRLLLKGLYTEPVLIENISQEGALLFVRVRTAGGTTSGTRSGSLLATHGSFGD
jgi:hypothetical protein